MAGKRTERLNEQFKREVAQILQLEVKDPRVGSVIVTGARVAPDLSTAQVYVMIPDEAATAETLKGLETAAPFIRAQLGQRLTLRRIPQLRFQHDASLQYGTHIERLLQDVKRSEAAASENPDADDA